MTRVSRAGQPTDLPLRLSLPAGLPITLCMGVMALPALGHAYAAACRVFYAVCYLIWIVPISLIQRALWRRGVSNDASLAVLLVATYVPSVINNALVQVAAVRWGLLPGYAMRRIFAGLDGCWLALIAFCAIHALLHHDDALQRSRRREVDAMALAREAPLRALHYQRQPPFFFNTLNSVSALVSDGRGSDATQMIALLGDLLRATLERGGSREMTVAEALSLTEHYLDIEKARPGRRLTISTRVGPGVLQALMPPLLLQPLVENAIRHGIAPRTAGGVVSLSIGREQDMLAIDLRNDGVTAPRDDLPERAAGVGLSNVRQRLEALYPGSHSLDFAVAPDGACTVRTVVPLRWGTAAAAAPSGAA